MSSLVRLLFGRSLNYSFAFAGEDRVIIRMLRPLIGRRGYYVDVGCNHPKFLSNTYSLYRRGWRGICIDANQRLVDKFGFYRPRDLAVCALISDLDGPRTFYNIQNNVLSTTEEQNIQSYANEGMSVVPAEMQAQTLTEVLEKAGAPKNFDLLNIDVEEHDLEALRSLDLSRHKPRLIVVEDETFDPHRSADNPICLYLSEHGYRLEGFVIKNLYFMSEPEPPTRRDTKKESIL